MTTNYYNNGSNHIVDFSILGKQARFETNGNGSKSDLFFDDVLICSESGDCFRWKNINNLYGAARNTAIAKQLRQHAEGQLARCIIETPKLFSRINELES